MSRTLFHASDDFNRDPVAPEFLGHPFLGIGACAAWTFSADFVSRFADQLLDFMGIPLPRYLGGAHNAWMIFDHKLPFDKVLAYVTRFPETGAIGFLDGPTRS